MNMKPPDELVTLSSSNPELRSEVLQLMLQHLHEEGYPAAVHALCAESRMNGRAAEGRKSQFRKVTAHILKGEWDDVGRVLTRNAFRSVISLHYAVYRQQYLERIEAGDGTMAVFLLKTKLKPLESQAPPGEFGVLTYLLSCNSVRDCSGGVFDHWKEDVGRQELVSQFKQLLESDPTYGLLSSVQHIPPGRLWTLLEQACGYQVLTQPSVSKEEKPVITTLARDYEPPVCPNSEKYVFKNASSVKCCAWMRRCEAISCGLADGTVCIWELPSDTDTALDGPTTLSPSDATLLLGHEGRVWSLADLSDSKAATGGADGTVRVWDVDPTSEVSREGGACRSVLRFHTNDVYTVNRHPDGVHLCSGGLDKIARLCNVEREADVHTFVGHTRPVTAARFNHFGNILFTGSKDGTVKLWDLSSGVCLQTVQQVQTKAAVSTLDLSPDGGTLLIGYQVCPWGFLKLCAMPRKQHCGL